MRHEQNSIGTSGPAGGKKHLAVWISAAAVLCAAGIFWFLFSRGAGVHREGENTPFPFTWTEKSNGAAELSIPLPDEGGYVWAPAAEDSDRLNISQPSVRKKLIGGGNGSSVFQLTPLERGLQVCTFLCEKEDDPLDRIYALDVTAYVSENLRLSIVQTAGRQLCGAGSAQAPTDAVCSWSGNQDGSLNLLLTSRAGETYDWRVSGCDESVVSAGTPKYDGDGCSLSVSAAGEGNSELTLTGTPQGTGSLPAAAFRLSLKCGGGVLVESASAEETSVPAISKEEIENRDAAEKALGRKIRLPEGAQHQTYQFADSTRETVSVTFFMDNRKWEYAVSSSLEIDGLADGYLSESARMQTVETGSVLLTVYTVSGSTGVFWKAADGVSCGLASQGASEAQLEAAAEAIFQTGQGG